jgi:hypothetical protein
MDILLACCQMISLTSSSKLGCGDPILDNALYCSLMPTAVPLCGTPLIVALLQYGHSRSAFDFEQAGKYLKPHRQIVAVALAQDIDKLRRAEPEALLQDVYWSAAMHLKNHNYCDFITAVVQFQENTLRLLLARAGLAAPHGYRETEAFWQRVKKVDEGNLWQSLEQQQKRHKYLRTQGELNNPTMIAILRHFNDPKVPINALEQLKEICDRRNQYIHRLRGVSEIKEAPDFLSKMRGILTNFTNLPPENPFDHLNKEILDRLKL